MESSRQKADTKFPVAYMNLRDFKIATVVFFAFAPIRRRKPGEQLRAIGRRCKDVSWSTNFPKESLTQRPRPSTGNAQADTLHSIRLTLNVAPRFYIPDEQAFYICEKLPTQAIAVGNPHFANNYPVIQNVPFTLQIAPKFDLVPPSRPYCASVTLADVKNLGSAQDHVGV